jgi:hypothetical protein
MRMEGVYRQDTPGAMADAIRLALFARDIFARRQAQGK